MAAAIPGPALAGLQRHLDGLAGHFPEARWTDETSRHITLKFLGSTPAGRLPEVERRCGAAASGAEPCELRFEGLGAFPRPARATVLWAGVGGDRGKLTQLAGGLDDALAPMGFRSEQRPFVAHATLARFRQPVRLELPELSPVGPFPVTQMALLQSHLSPRGARYTALATFPLGR